MPPDERNTSDEHAILPFVGLNNWLRTRRTLAVVRPIAPVFDQSYNRFLPVSQPVSTGIPSRVSPVSQSGFTGVSTGYQRLLHVLKQFLNLRTILILGHHRVPCPNIRPGICPRGFRRPADLAPELDT